MASLSDQLENALRRVAVLGSRGDAGPSALTVTARRAIIEQLASSDEPLSADDIAQALELHVTTARHHLEVLEASGLVSRTTAAPHGRGRPRILYEATARVSDTFQELAKLLDRAVESGEADSVAMSAAVRWAQRVAPASVANDPDEAVSTAVESLQSAGFTAKSNAIGDAIVVRDCPYGELISQHPMICTVHAELVSGVLEATGQDVTLDRFDVRIKPGVCRATLIRPDLKPEFSPRPRPKRDTPKEKP